MAGRNSRTLQEGFLDGGGVIRKLRFAVPCRREVGMMLVCVTAQALWEQEFVCT